VDTVTQRNASSAEELSSTAEELATQSEQLQQLMTFFRLAGGTSTYQRSVSSQPTSTRPLPRIPAAELTHAHPSNGRTSEERNFTAF